MKTGRGHVKTRSLNFVAVAAGVFLIATLASPAPAGWAAEGRRCGSGVSRQDRLVYERMDGSRTDIWTMRGDGSGRRALTFTGTERWPEFSPLGDRIAFGSRRDGNLEIYVMNADGSGVRNLTNTPTIREAKPTWAPGGRRIAFHSTPITSLDLDNPDIEVINIDGNGRRNLTITPLVKEVKPSWSPDGTKIAFEAGEPAISTAAPNDDIWIMNADGSDRRRLTIHPGREWFPSWSPDSRRIAFMSGRDGNFEIYVMDADGSDQTRLTENQTFDSLPTWSPDGSRITYGEDDSILVPTPGVYVSPTEPTVGNLVAVRTDGTDPIRITNRGIQYAPDYRTCSSAAA